VGTKESSSSYRLLKAAPSLGQTQDRDAKLQSQENSVELVLSRILLCGKSPGTGHGGENKEGDKSISQQGISQDAALCMVEVRQFELTDQLSGRFLTAGLSKRVNDFKT
jgi:hypothetical protein